MTLIFPVAPGIVHMRNQSKHGPRFPVNPTTGLSGMCLGTLANFVLGHPSGADTAFLGWQQSKHKHRYDPNTSLDAFLKTVPRAFPLWFDGGTPTPNHPEGDGHVTFSAVPFWNWSLDRIRGGFYDRVTVHSILTWNKTHPHRLLGWTEDIAGFMLPYKPHSMDPHK